MWEKTSEDNKNSEQCRIHCILFTMCYMHILKQLSFPKPVKFQKVLNLIYIPQACLPWLIMEIVPRGY